MLVFIYFFEKSDLLRDAINAKEYGTVQDVSLKCMIC